MTEDKREDVLLKENPNTINNIILGPQKTGEKPSINAALSDNVLRSVVFFGSTGALVFFGLLAILPIAQVIIGRHYAKACPIDPHIPHYLVVAGSVALADIILILLLGIVVAAVIKPAMDATGDENRLVRIAAKFCCINCTIVVVLCGLSTFLSIWTIAGLVWVFGAWSKVQYTEPNNPNYCHPTLYRFTYWLFFLPFILGFVVCCFPIIIACCSAPKIVKKGLQLVPTTEP